MSIVLLYLAGYINKDEFGEAAEQAQTPKSNKMFT